MLEIKCLALPTERGFPKDPGHDTEIRSFKQEGVSPLIKVLNKMLP